MEPKDYKSAELDALYPIAEGSCHLMIGCRGADYAASRIAGAIEDSGAQMLNLNVMTDPDGVYDLLVDVRINRPTSLSAVRSLMRYGYDVIGVNEAEGADDSILKERIDQLLRYINI